MKTSNVEAFLTSEEENEVVNAIRQAEKETSGEIRVHIEGTSKKTPLERAHELFHFLKMDNTKDENGVLIYVATNDKTFAIYGDKGIDKVVPKDFWNSTKDIIQNHFRNKRFKDGLVEGILKAGEELQKHFPWQHDDVNELPDQISKS
ncbi:TPM domain-containing protein [Joostella sp. CR20]|uniref:TPM domain-containing protein n=1 Tax=Joostella sp. CR20 TaxID=2804312 RepID=UPI00313B22D9